MDIKRYKNILNTEQRIKCLGQHFQYPIIQSFNESMDNLIVREKLKKQVQREFIGNAPPFQSGTYNIIKLLQSLCTNNTAMVSSYSPINDSFLCGSLKISSGVFRENKPSTINEKKFIEQQVHISKEMIKRYLQ